MLKRVYPQTDHRPESRLEFPKDHHCHLLNQCRNLYGRPNSERLVVSHLAIHALIGDSVERRMQNICVPNDIGSIRRKAQGQGRHRCRSWRRYHLGLALVRAVQVASGDVDFQLNDVVDLFRSSFQICRLSVSRGELGLPSPQCNVENQEVLLVRPSRSPLQP